MATVWQKCKPACTQPKCGHPWTVRYRAAGGRSGRQREKSFRRKRDADQFATKMENDKHAGIYIDPQRGKITLRSYSLEWLYGRNSISQRSYERYNGLLKEWIIPQLGDKPLDRIDRSDIQAFVNTMCKTLAPSTVGDCYGVFRSVIRTALAEKRIQDDPCQRIELPQRATFAVGDEDIPSSRQVHRIAGLMNPADRVAVWLMAGCGLRVGEATGLTTDCVRGDYIRLTHQIGRPGEGGAVFAPLKHRTVGEWRDVPLPEYVAEKITAHVKQYGTHEVQGRHLLFRPGPSSRSPVVNARAMSERYRHAVRGAGLAYKAHGLRHFFATTALTEGVPIHEVSRWIGHKSIQITVDTYGHLTEGSGDRCRVALQSALSNPC